MVYFFIISLEDSQRIYNKQFLTVKLPYNMYYYMQCSRKLDEPIHYLKKN